jgi:hypothetical protein
MEKEGSVKLSHRVVVATAAMVIIVPGLAGAEATIGTSPLASYTYSKEGLALSGVSVVSLPDIVVTFGNNLTYQDDVIITLPGAASIAAVPSATLVTCLQTPTTIGYVTTVEGGWNFRVTSVSGVSLGDTCTFKGLQVTANSLEKAPGTLNYRAVRFQTGQLVDTATTANAVAVRSQYGITPVVRLNGVINVYVDRKWFAHWETEAPGNTAFFGDFHDTLNFETLTGGGYVTFVPPVVSTTAQTLTISGDFAWADASPNGNGNGTCEASEIDAALVGYAGWTVSDASDCRKAVLVGPLTGGAFTGYFKVPGTEVLTPTDWQGSVEFKYSLGSVSGSTALDWDPGIWTINASQVYIQYLPYGTGISRIIYAANRGLSDAVAQADVYHGGKLYSCTLGVVSRRAVTELSGPVDACVQAQGIASGKVAVTLTFIAQDKDIEVYSAYNVGGNDRGTVVNTSNGRSFYYGTGVSFPEVHPQ